jgi:hypothetical protein
MIVYTYSDARQKLAELLERAKKEDVIIKRKDGLFRVKAMPSIKSPLDVPGVDTLATTDDILSAIREGRPSRER